MPVNVSRALPRSEAILEGVDDFSRVQDSVEHDGRYRCVVPPIVVR